MIEVIFNEVRCYLLSHPVLFFVTFAYAIVLLSRFYLNWLDSLGRRK